jgi:site-specific DNA recombinase
LPPEPKAGAQCGNPTCWDLRRGPPVRAVPTATGDKRWPKVKIQKKLATIEAERAEIAAQLTDTTSKLDTGRQFFMLALELLSDPQGFYRSGNAAVKKAMTKLAFGKIKLNAHHPQGQELAAFVASHELTEGIDALVEVGSITGSTRYRISTTLTLDSKRDPIPEDGVSLDRFTAADLLAAVLLDQGSNKGAVVELRGVEPLTSSMRTRRATNCATAPG